MNSNTNGLLQDVLQLIEKIYCRKYIGRLEVIYHPEDGDNPAEYILHMYPHKLIQEPLCIAILCDTDELFLAHIEKELKTRNLIRSDFYKIELHGNN